MERKTEKCPNCGGELKFRLGYLECVSCDYQVEIRKFGDEASRKESAQVLPPGASQPSAFQPEAIYQRPMPSSVGAEPDPLAKEKLAFIVVTILQSLAGFAISAGADASSPLGGEVSLAERFLTAIIGAGIGVALVALVLYARIIWLKACCAGCLLVSVVANSVFAFALWGLFASFQGELGLPPPLLTQAKVQLILGLIMSLWFLSILFRDIRWISSKG